jgi:hypothetical protein
MKEGCNKFASEKVGEEKLVNLWEDYGWSSNQGIGRGIWEMNRKG